MQATVKSRCQVVRQLVVNGDNALRVLSEQEVAGAYREHRLTMEQVRELLGYGTRMQVDAFLHEHEIYDYTVEDLDVDMATLERLFPSDQSQPRV